jgi:hypothetical protein
MSFSKSVFLAGFNQKITKKDLFVKGNHVIPHDKQRGKTLEDFRNFSTEADHVTLPCGAGRPHCQVGRPVGPTISLRVAMSILHRLKDCIYAVDSSRFDLGAQN